jgi:LPXTG-site transpeptidase (sortase) family protein
MKAGASIIVSFVVGALVVAAVAGWDSATRAAQPAAVQTSAPARAYDERVRAVPAAPRPIRVDALPAVISIPRLHLKAQIGTTLDRGPAWWPVTGRPGGGDTIAVAGHRTTHTRPFYWLERVRPGDSIYIRWHGRVHAYKASGRRILSAKQLHIGDARGHEVLLLSACTPRGSARQRIVVYAWPRA